MVLVFYIGLLNPFEVIENAIDYAKSSDVPINSTEGFVRQILGWREFIRGVYEVKGTEERTKNFWNFKRKIPSSFYDGSTGIKPVDDVIKKVKRNCTTKFNESIDVSCLLNLKQKKEEISLRTLVNLPNGNGKKVKVAVLCEENKIKEAKDSGAEIAGFDNLVNDITNGKINFDKLIATPATMSKMGKLGKILGPKGLMPNPKFGTVTNDIKTSVKAIKNGQIEIKNDKDGNIAVSIGKKSFSDAKLKENYDAFMNTLLKEKPTGIKGNFILSAYLTSTMGVSYQLKL